MAFKCNQVWILILTVNALLGSSRSNGLTRMVLSNIEVSGVLIGSPSSSVYAMTCARSALLSQW